MPGDNVLVIRGKVYKQGMHGFGDEALTVIRCSGHAAHPCKMSGTVDFQLGETKAVKPI